MALHTPRSISLYHFRKFCMEGPIRIERVMRTWRQNYQSTIRSFLKIRWIQGSRYDTDLSMTQQRLQVALSQFLSEPPAGWVHRSMIFDDISPSSRSWIVLVYKHFRDGRSRTTGVMDLFLPLTWLSSSSTCLTSIRIIKRAGEAQVRLGMHNEC